MAAPVPILNYFRPNQFSIGDVLTRTWSVLTRNLITFLILGAVADLPALALNVFNALQATKLAGQTPSSDFIIKAALIAIASLLVTALISQLCQSVVVYAAFQDLRGRAVSLGDSVSQVLNRFLSVIGTVLLTGLCVGLGMLLCLVPGFIISAMLAVAVPACIVERKGPSASFSRSSDLTSGYRWPIFGITIAIGIVVAVVSSLLTLVTPSFSPFAAPAVQWLWGSFTMAFNAVFAAMLYHDLRASKEGIDAQEIASVFD